MKLTRRHLQQALVLALDELAEHKAALDELGDRWQLIHDLLDAERETHKATREQLDQVRSELATLRAFSTPGSFTAEVRIAAAEVADCTYGAGCPLHPTVDGMHNFDPICEAPTLHAPHEFGAEICTGGLDPDSVRRAGGAA